MITLLKKIALGSAILVIIGIVVFVYEEVRRAHLLKSYEAPSELIKQLRMPGVKNISSLTKNDESMVCLMDGYGMAEHLSQLNDRQKRSLPKNILPSEDLTWYLIFLSEDKYTRIYLLDKFGDQGIDASEGGCLTLVDSLLVTPESRPDGSPTFKMTFQSKPKGTK